jgi:hypothetical protein
VTLSIIFALLRDLLPQGAIRSELQDCLRRPERALRAHPEEARVRLRPIDHELFEACVQTPEGTRKLPAEGPTEASDRLLAVIKAIKADIGTVGSAYIEGLTRYILNNCYVVRIQARNLDDAYVLFRSLNSRGLPLNELDVIRTEPSGRTTIRSWPNPSPNAGTAFKPRSATNEFLTYVRTIVSLVRPQALDTDLRDILRELLQDPTPPCRSADTSPHS